MADKSAQRGSGRGAGAFPKTSQTKALKDERDLQDLQGSMHLSSDEILEPEPKSGLEAMDSFLEGIVENFQRNMNTAMEVAKQEFKSQLEIYKKATQAKEAEVQRLREEIEKLKSELQSNKKAKTIKELRERLKKTQGELQRKTREYEDMKEKYETEKKRRDELDGKLLQERSKRRIAESKKK